MFEGDRFWVRHFLTPFFCWGFPPCPQRLLLLSAFERYLGCFMAHPNVARMHDARKRGAEMRHHGVGDAQTQGSYLYTTLVWQPKTSGPLWVRGYVGKQIIHECYGLHVGRPIPTILKPTSMSWHKPTSCWWVHYPLQPHRLPISW